MPDTPLLVCRPAEPSDGTLKIIVDYSIEACEHVTGKLQDYYKILAMESRCLIVVDGVSCMLPAVTLQTGLTIAWFRVHMMPEVLSLLAAACIHRKEQADHVETDNSMLTVKTKKK